MGAVWAGVWGRAVSPPLSRDVVDLGQGSHMQWGSRMAFYYTYSAGAPVFWVMGDYFRLEDMFVL